MVYIIIPGATAEKVMQRGVAEKSISKMEFLKIFKESLQKGRTMNREIKNRGDKEKINNKMVVPYPVKLNKHSN